MTLELYWLENCPYYDSRVIIYACIMFIRLAPGADPARFLAKIYAMLTNFLSIIIG